MAQEEFPCWTEACAAFCRRFDDLFTRRETRQQAQKDIRGLLALASAQNKLAVG